MKGFSDVSRAATCASGVILESRSPESVVAKRRDSVTLRAAKPYGMTSVWGGRTANTSILSSPRNWRAAGFGDLLLSKRENDRFPTTTFGNDDTLKFVRATRAGFTLIELLVVVLIIGILAGAALPQYQRAVQKTRLTNALQIAFNIRKAQEIYYLANGTYTEDLYSLDIDYSKSGCTIASPDTSIMNCKNTIFDNIVGPVGNPIGHRVSFDYSSDKIVKVDVYFEHSSKPNQVECTGKTDEGIALCKSLNL